MGFLLLWASPAQLSYPSSLGLMGLPSTPYFLCLHYFRPAVAHSHFSTSYTAHGFAIPLFPSFLKPVCFLKAHLSISWTCNPLFLLLGLNSFFYPFTNCFLPVLMGFFLFGFPKTTVNKGESSTSDPRTPLWKKLLHLNIPTKIRICAWKMCMDGLLTMLNLQKRS